MLRQVHASRVDHILIDEVVDAPGKPGNRQARVLGEGSQGRLRGRKVDAHAAADKIAGIEITEYQIGIGDRWEGSTPTIGGRSGFGAGTLGTDLHKSDLIEVRNRATTCTDLDQLQ